MSNDVIFTTQLLSIFGFIASLFILYRLLVHQKDSVIEFLREQIKAQDKKINELESQTPDALAQSLSQRIEISIKEIERLKEDESRNITEIESKERDLKSVQGKLTDLIATLQDTDLLCPECQSPLLRREFFPIHGYVGGREVEAEGEFVEYECGLSYQDDEKVGECSGTGPNTYEPSVRQGQ